MKTTRSSSQPARPPAATPPAAPDNLPVPIPPKIPAVTFTKVDNNLTSIGFFTASSKRSRKAIEKVAILIEQGVARRITILPSAKYGMPVTLDQDYWLALMKLVSEHVRLNGKLINPFVFTTADLRHVLGQANSGRNYEAVHEWLSVMSSTTIEGGSYNAARKSWCTEKTHALDRVIAMGKQLPDGRIADKNYVWFSEWQLDNINSGNLIPIELSIYIQLKTNIARNLVPHLQEWLFASQQEGRFEKKYEDICRLLGIRVYEYLSKIEEKLAPSLNELVTHGYLSRWAVEPMANEKGYKLVLWHGAKYHTDRKSRLESQRLVDAPGSEESPATRRPRQRRLPLTPPDVPAPAEPQKAAAAVDGTLLAELVKRGIGESDARKLLSKLAPDQPVMDQIEYADAVIQQSRGKIQNHQGFYISRLQDNAPNPPWFETAAVRKIREEAEAALALAIAEQRLAQLHAEETERRRMDAEIDALPESAVQALFEQAKAQLLASYPGMTIFFQSHPEEAIRDGAVRGKMRQIFARR